MPQPDISEIDFAKGGDCVRTYKDELLNISERLRVFKNPWTGNKRKLLVDIFMTIQDEGIEFDSMLDLFAGSGMVGMAGKMLGKRVISNDLMTFSYLFLKAFIENNEIDLSRSEMDYLLKNQNKDCGSFVLDQYAKIESPRFSEREAELLDNYYANVLDLFGTREECSVKFCLALIHVLYYVMDSCFVGGRLNKGQVLANLEHRIKHKRNDWREMTFKAIRLINPSDFANGGKHQAENEDAEILLNRGNIEADLVYIDPPYGGQQSDYVAMYRFFEEYIYQSSDLGHAENGDKFNSSKDYYDNFLSLLKACSSFKTLVISYNDSSWANISEIRSCIQNVRESVVVKDVDYKYQYRSRSNSKEHIIIAR